MLGLVAVPWVATPHEGRMPRDGSLFPQPLTYCELLRELSHPESSLVTSLNGAQVPI
jgi:hypothetical protein